EPAREPNPGLLGAGVLSSLRVEDAVLDQRGQAAVDVAAAEVVRDEQRLERRVGGGIREPRLEDGDGTFEVGRQQPLAMAGFEGVTQLPWAATADVEQRLGDRPAERARLD